MNLTRAAIEQNRVTIVTLLIIALAGVLSFFSLPQAKDPGFLVRLARVTTIFPGASPERVEQLITDKIENAIQEIPEVDYIASTSKTSVSITLIAVKEKYTNLREIWDNLRRKVDDVAATLPDGVIGPDVNDDFGETFGILLGITGEGISYAELEDIADEVRDALLLIEEVAKVEFSGVQDERIFVEYNNARLAQIGLSPVQLKAILAQRNIIIPGGEVSTGVEEIGLEPSGNFESIDDLEKTVIQLPGKSQLTYLGDIVNIRRAYVDPPDDEMRVNGQPAIGLAISLRDGANIVALGEKVDALLDRLPEAYPHGVDFHLIHFEPEEVSQKVNDFVVNVLQSIAVVMLVMLVFLGVRTGLVVASLIPTTMLATLIFMSMLDIGLDQVSLASLIIALGMLVDNAIVMTESIMVKMEEGEKPIDAAVSAARELRVSLLTSSLTTCAAFLPIFLAESAVGEYTSSIFKVVSISLLSSWVLALTMTPLFAVTFLKLKRAKQAKLPARGPDGQQWPQDAVNQWLGDPMNTRFYRYYRGMLVGMLKLRYVGVAAVIGGLVVAMIGFRSVPKRFFPEQEIPQFNATFRLPTGTVLSRTQAMVDELEKYMTEELMATDDRPQGIVTWGSFIGIGAPRYNLSYRPEPPAPEYAFMLINTTSNEVIPELIAKLDGFAFERFPDVESELKVLSSGPPVASPIEIRISGSDQDKLFAIADQVKAKLRTVRGPKELTDDWGRQTKKLVIDVSQARAFRAGVTNQDIAISLLANFTGVKTSEYRENDQIIPITMRSTATDRDDIGKLETLNIYSQATGRSVPLKQVADAKIMWEPSRLRRRNRASTIAVLAQLEPGVTAAQVNAEMIPWLDEQVTTWGPGYRYEIGGVTESSQRANRSIAAKLPIAGFIILILLVMQFNSMRCTLIILFTIPMALIGVVIGLLAVRSYFGFMTLLGIVSLFGIVINNAIVLIERIKFEMDENGLTPQDAVIEASQRRLRPILLTTATTMGGLLPLWFGGGAMWEPMAIAIIFGLAFSTVLTLGLVPALYAIFYRISYRQYRYVGAQAPAAPAPPQQQAWQGYHPAQGQPYGPGPRGGGHQGGGHPGGGHQGGGHPGGRYQGGGNPYGQ